MKMKRSKLLVAVALLALVTTVISCAAPTPEVIEKEVVVEKLVVETVVVEKEVVVEKPVVETVIVEKEVVVAPTPGIREGGTLRRASLAGFESFNPFLWTNLTTEAVFGHVYNALIRWSSDMSHIIPELAESWDVSEDGKVYTFHLRKGVEWHDGKPFTAEDVEFTLVTHLHPKGVSALKDAFLHLKGAEAYNAGETRTVPGIEVIDDYTVKVETTEPYAPFLSRLAITFIAPKHMLKDVPVEDIPNSDFAVKSPIGTGPYEVVHYVPDEFIEFVRNPDYFRGASHIERVVLSNVARDATVTAIRTGELDYSTMWGVAAEDMLALREEGFTLATPNWGFWSFYCNIDRPYLNNEICQAMLYAIDAESISKEVFKSLAKAMPTYFDHPWIGLSPELNWYKYDPEKARALLEEAGWDFDRELVAVVLGSAEDPARVAIQQWLGDVGIKVKMEATTDGATWRERVPKNRDWDILPFKGRSWGVSPDTVRRGFACDMGWPKSEKSTGYCNPHVDELFDRAVSLVDREERAKIYQELQLILNKEGGDFPLLYGATGLVASPRLKDARLVMKSFGIPYAALHEWWLAEE